MKIKLPQIEIYYEYALKLYNKQITIGQAKLELHEKGLNTNSANYYLYIYPSLIEGRIFKGTINAQATRYYLDKILQTKGTACLHTALQALSLHIDYYETVSKANALSQREILVEYLSKYDLKYDSYFEENIKDEGQLLEGLTKQVTVNIYERNPIARAKCIEHFGPVCNVCEFDFEQKYGAIGKGFIHVHHVVDISTIGEEYKVDYTKDLVPVCPNCHAMLHKQRPSFTTEELKKLLNMSTRTN